MKAASCGRETGVLQCGYRKLGSNFKGKRMAGHMGTQRVTVKNLTVAYVSAEDNLIGLKGAVPGPRKGLVVIGGNA